MRSLFAEFPLIREDHKMQNIDINEAKRRLPELIEQASSGDEVIITKSGQPIVKLVAITKPYSCINNMTKWV